MTFTHAHARSRNYPIFEGLTHAHLCGLIIDGSCRVTLVVAFDFFPNILGSGDLQMVLCHSVNEG